MSSFSRHTLKYESVETLSPNTRITISLTPAEPFRMLRACVTDNCKITCVRHLGVDVPVQFNDNGVDLILNQTTVFPPHQIHLIVENPCDKATHYNVFVFGYVHAAEFVEAPSFAKVNRTMGKFDARIKPDSPRAAIWRKTFGADVVPVTSATAKKPNMSYLGWKPEIEPLAVFWVDMERLTKEQVNAILLFFDAQQYNLHGEEQAILDNFGFPIPGDDLEVIPDTERAINDNNEGHNEADATTNPRSEGD